MKPMLTTAEVAEHLGGDTTDAWVRERCADGTIPAHKIGRSWRIKQVELDAWIEGQRFVPEVVPTFEQPRAIAGGDDADLIELLSLRSVA